MATAGLYFVWVPRHSTRLAELVGVGRGVDLILYVWVCISLILLLSLHLKLRMQRELITMLARKLALADAHASISIVEKDSGPHSDLEFYPSPTLAPTSEPQAHTRHNIIPKGLRIRARPLRRSQLPAIGAR